MGVFAGIILLAVDLAFDAGQSQDIELVQQLVDGIAQSEGYDPTQNTGTNIGAGL
ncbi:hypothetical protein ACX80D_12885 [Arthrobacter sp. Sr24]